MSLVEGREWKAKAFGAFYTPPDIASVLAEWIVRSGRERILEPSAGDGALIRAARDRSGCLLGRAMIDVVACDVDPGAVRALTGCDVSDCEVRAIDFLRLDPAEIAPFDGVLANPPFTRNHSIDALERGHLRQRFEISGSAGLWVHFLLHALTFLRPGGRMAAVVPRSALFTDYGRAALGRLSSAFADVELREFVDKPAWVNGAEERGAMFLAQGFGRGTSPPPRATLWSSSGRRVDDEVLGDPLFDRLLREARALSDVATLSIGAVTGCNAVFLMSEGERRAYGVDHADLRAIVSRTRHVPGLSADGASLIARGGVGEKIWLLAPRSADERGGGVRRRLAEIPASKRRSTRWFSKRKPWWRIDVPACDAIFTYMNDAGPRLVLTNGSLACTNTLHCARFAPDVSRDDRFAASLSLQSTFGQAVAERVGRVYGGGVLKFELKDARRMPVLPSAGNLREAHGRADRALRGGDATAATAIADEAVLAPLLGADWRRVVAAIRGEVAYRRLVRKGGEATVIV